MTSDIVLPTFFDTRLMSGIFTEQKSNVNNDPYFRFFAFDLAFEFT